jgi:hypothetical protein
MAETDTYKKILQNEIISVAMIKATDNKLFREVNKSEVTDQMGINRFGELCELDSITKVLVEAENLRFDNVTKIVLLILLQKFTTAVNKKSSDSQISEASRITITVDEYMRIRGTSNRTDAYRALNRAIEVMFNTIIETEITVRKKRGEKINTKKMVRCHLIASKSEVINAEIMITLNPDLAINLAREGYILHIPKSIYMIETNRSPYALSIAYKLCLHKNINQDIGKCSKLSMCKIICFIRDLPTYEEVKKSSNRHFDRRVINPILATIEMLRTEGILTHYHFVDKNNNDISLNDLKRIKHKAFYDLYLVYEISDFPVKDHKE